MQHTAEQLGDVDARRTDKHGAAFVAHLDDFVDDGGVLLTLRLVHAVVEVFADDGAVCRDFDDVELVDVPELASLGDGRTGHA